MVPEDDIAGGENPYEDNPEGGSTEGSTEEPTGENPENGGIEGNTGESSTEENTENQE